MAMAAPTKLTQPHSVVTNPGPTRETGRLVKGWSDHPPLRELVRDGVVEGFRIHVEETGMFSGALGHQGWDTPAPLASHVSSQPHMALALPA